MTVRIQQGDCREVLKTLESDSVNCCVTSPPYFGLRDYGTAAWAGGRLECDHKQATEHQKQGATSARAGRSNTEAQRNENFRDVCGKCGAMRADHQIGLEPTPDEFVAALVEVFREVRRVLRPDGTLWLNLGDSYASGGRATYRSGASDNKGQLVQNDMPRPKDVPGIKPKDLLGIPWMVAFALRADGWYLRQDIIWSKPNPMPESVTDRCTKAHEYLFLLSKSPRYYFDADAIREPFADASLERLRQDIENQAGSDRVPGKTNGPMKAVGNLRKTDSTNESFVPDGSPHTGLHRAGTPRGGLNANRSSYKPGSASNMNDGEHVPKSDAGLPLNEAGRNKRSVWTITTQPFKEAHFATFPPALIEPCILAGSPKGGTVLDPFGGAGTTGLVADRLRRDAVLIELNPDYVKLAAERIYADAGMFHSVAV